MTEHEAVVISAAFGTVGVVVAAWLASHRRNSVESHSQKQAHLETQTHLRTVEFAQVVHEWRKIDTEIHALIDETCIDRVLMLRAWNGRDRPKRTSVVLRWPNPTNDVRATAYKNYPIDLDYAERMKKMEDSQNGFTFYTKDLGPSGIRDIYNAEGVTGSHWGFVLGYQVPDYEDVRAVTYTSWATSDDIEIPADVITRCNIIVHRMHGLAGWHSPGETLFG